MSESPNIPKSPFKFLDFFEKGDIKAFFGREDEVDVIYTYLHESNVLLVNGPSGTGKSSIVQCGLASRFEKTDWLDVFVRRHININDSLQEKINKVNIKDFSKGTSIIESLKSLYLDFFKPIYLIFDQFEELFILGNKAEQVLFFDNLRAILDEKGIPCKIILIVREKYIAQLQAYEKTIPEIFDKRVRIEHMTDENIKEVIFKSCEVFDIGIESPETVDEIIKNLKIEAESLIELPHLQIYLDRLWKEAGIANGQRLFALSLVKKIGDIHKVLKEFLDERIKEVNQNLAINYPNTSENDAKQLLIKFTTDEGTKKPRKKGDILANLANKEIDYFIIDELEKQSILRLEKANIEYPDESIYEISHDSLAKIIYNQLHSENNQLRRAVKIIKDGAADYNPSVIYFKRSFLNKNQLSEVALLENKIKNNIPEKEQPTPSEWKIVGISKRFGRFKNWFSVLVPLMIFLAAIFYISKLTLEQNTKFELLTELATSPTQKYQLYHEYERQSLLKAKFRTNNSDILEEIKELPQKENLYYLSIAHDEPIVDIIFAKINLKQYFVIVGEKNLSFFDAKTGKSSKIFKDFDKLKEIKIDDFNIKLAFKYKSDTAKYQEYLIVKAKTQILGKESSTLALELENKEEKLLSTNNRGFQVLMNDYYYKPETKSLDGIIDDTTKIEYKFDKEHSYSFFKKYDSLMIVADKLSGICRFYKAAKSKESEIDLNFLPEEKLRFFINLSSEDYLQLMANKNPNIQEKTWQKLENDYLKNSSFLNRILPWNQKVENEKYLNQILKNIIEQAQRRDIYLLWTKIYRKINHKKDATLQEIYKKHLTLLEKKVDAISDEERAFLFRYVRIQSKSGANDEHIVFLDNIHQQRPNDACLNTLLSVVYNNAAWFKLYEKNFELSKEYATKGVAINLPKEQLNYINVNLAHGYLCNNQVAEATNLYKKYANFKNYDQVGCNYDASDKLNKTIMITDLNDLMRDKIIPENLTSEALKIIYMLEDGESTFKKD